jgi:hypothetical protein
MWVWGLVLLEQAGRHGFVHMALILGLGYRLYLASLG